MGQWGRFSMTHFGGTTQANYLINQQIVWAKQKRPGCPTASPKIGCIGNKMPPYITFSLLSS